MLSQIAAIFGAIVIVAGIAVVVGSPYVAAQIRAFGDAFAGGLKAAKG